VLWHHGITDEPGGQGVTLGRAWTKISKPYAQRNPNFIIFTKSAYQFPAFCTAISDTKTIKITHINDSMAN